MENNGRDEAGRFAAGNPGGPGRPRRLIERDYLSAISSAVSIEDWQEIVKVTLAKAKAGDSRAREWIARFLLGNEPPKLLDLAVDEARGVTAEGQIDDMARQAEAEAKANLAIDELAERVYGN